MTDPMTNTRVEQCCGWHYHKLQETVARAERERLYAIRWANQSVDMLKDAFFPVADALRDLEAYLYYTPHQSAPEVVAARRALARFDAVLSEKIEDDTP